MIKNKEGLPSHLEGIILDINRQKTVEKQLEKSLVKIQKINRELHKAMHKAEESDRLKSAFLANMSHEIRTPMNAIMGFSGLLLHEDIPKEKKDQFVNIIRNSGENLLRLINDILDISKIEVGEIEIIKKPVDLDDFFVEVESLFASRVKYLNLNNLRLCFRNRNEQMIIEVDETRLKQIIGNLLENAIKNSGEGEIEFGYDVEGKEVRFYVSDTGPGIPHDKQKFIFDRFNKIDTEKNQPYGGAGLGLAITKSLVELMGGQIGLKSKLGEGTTFCFTLPYNKTIFEPVTHANVPFKVTKEVSILVVEDDYNCRQFLAEVLNVAHITVDFVGNGRTALQKVRQNDYDIILMDIQLPDIAGLEVTKKIREFNQDIIIIAQTAFAMSNDEEKCLNQGCNAYISKPIQIDKLRKLINIYS